jgi:hypothetical protein
MAVTVSKHAFGGVNLSCIVTGKNADFVYPLFFLDPCSVFAL